MRYLLSVRIDSDKGNQEMFFRKSNRALARLMAQGAMR